MAHQLQNVISLNNNAVLHINSGTFDFAIDILASALKLARRNLEILQMTPRQCLDRSYRYTSNFNLNQCVLAVETKERERAMINKTTMEDLVSAGSVSECDRPLDKHFDRRFGRSFMFRRPLHIPVTAEDETENDYPSTVKVVSVTILFNLALAHHLTSYSKPTYKSQLKTAATLYELAYTLICEERIDDSALLTMVIINNLGLIHSALEEETMAQQCFEHLLSTLMFLVDRGEGPNVSGLFLGLFHNTSYLIFPNDSTAAAAA